MDSIEDVSIDVDVAEDADGERPARIAATLILEGDFTDACEQYLEITDDRDSRFAKLFLDLPRDMAEDLYKELDRILHGS